MKDEVSKNSRSVGPIERFAAITFLLTVCGIAFWVVVSVIGGQSSGRDGSKNEKMQQLPR